MPIRDFCESKIFESKDSIIFSERGLTLLELIMVMVIMSILAVFITDVIFYDVAMYNKLANQTEGMQVARNALQMLGRDLRQIMAPDSIHWASSDSIRFDDINNVSISYRFLNQSIYRDSDLLINTVDQFQLRYFDDNNNQLSSPVTNPALINSIAVSLTASFGGESVHLDTRIQPRTF